MWGAAALVSVAAQLGITVVAAALAGWAAFQWLGKRWLESQFAKSLERFKHAQTTEIERLRYRINALMDRTSKLHQNEFEVLPEIWDKLGKAFGETSRFTSPLQSYPDLNRMDFGELTAFFDRSRLEDWQKNKIASAERMDRNSAYQEFIFWHDLNRARETHAEFHNYLIQKGIFIQPALKEKIRVISDAMYDALDERRLDREAPTFGAGRFAMAERLRAEGPRLIQEVELEVQSRLWDANKLD